MFSSTPRHCREVRRRCGSGVEIDLFAWELLPPSQRRTTTDKTCYRMRYPSLLPPERQVDEEGPNALAGRDRRELVRRRSYRTRQGRGEAVLTWVRLREPKALVPLVYIRERPMKIKAQEASED
jgi:hypothetical protein